MRPPVQPNGSASELGTNRGTNRAVRFFNFDQDYEFQINFQLSLTKPRLTPS
jgi:hypothetical protein